MALSTLARGVVPLLKELAGLKATLTQGAAAGNLTVTGIATTDVLVAVLRIGVNTLVPFTVAGGAAGNFTVTGIATEDTLVQVLNIDIGGDAIANLTSEFTISAADTINNTGGTASTGGVLVGMYRDAAVSDADLTSEFSITAANTINNTGGTSTLGCQVLVLYRDVSAYTGA